MKILVTGANGFIGKNLIAELRNQGYENIIQFTRQNSYHDLELFTQNCDFVYHLAGVNRPDNIEEFFEGNSTLTEKLVSSLKKNNNNAPILFSSSIQAEKDNSYGQSKKIAENTLESYEEDTGTKTYIFRLPNVFGKWSKPNYNSVVSTFCYNIARNQEIQINNPDVMLSLVYIDDVIDAFIRVLQSQNANLTRVEPVHRISLQNLADTIYSFKESRENLRIPDMQNPLVKKLYSTYLSFLPGNEFSYKLKMNEDYRGSFTEILKTVDRGQVSVNVSKPGITKGNHWHHTKNEKFIVVSGEGLIRFRKIGSDEVIEYRVSGGNLEVVDIPVGYTHSIVNIGKTDMVTVMWANELFDPECPDTYYLEV